MKYARLSAKSGNALSQFWYGILRVDKDAINQNIKKGMKYLQRSADQGNVDAQFQYAVQLWIQLPPNYEEAVHYLEKAVDQEHVSAQLKFSKALYTGQGVTRDPIRSMKYARLSAKNGDALAQSWYGILLMDQNRMNANITKGMKYLQRSVDQGNADVQFQCGMQCLQLLRHLVQTVHDLNWNAELPYMATLINIMIIYMMIAAHQGHSQAQVVCSRSIGQGFGINHDLMLSAEYARLSAQQGNACGQYLYGYKLLIGEGVERNVNEGMKYLRRSANQGNAGAQFAYGHHCLQMPELCSAESVNYLRMAADQGHCEAQRDYGRCLLLGLHVTDDFSSAIDCYIKASENNDISSQIIVAAYFCCGRLDNLEIEDRIGWLNADLTSFNPTSRPKWIIEAENSMLNGTGETDIVCAIHELRMKADDGYSRAQLLCGLCLRSHNEGVRYLKRASDQNEQRALLELLNLFREGYRDIHLSLFEIAHHCIKIATSSNESITIWVMELFAMILTRASIVRKFLVTKKEGSVCNHRITSHFVVCKFGRISQFANSEWSELLTKFKTLIENREGLKMWMDGWCYENGFGVELNLPRAAKLYRQSSEFGFSLGQYHYGLFLCHGIGVKRNVGEAVHQLSLAAKGGNVDAIFEYGICLDFGVTVKANVVEAINYYQRAAAQNHISALKAYGDCLMTGRGVEVNQRFGRECLYRANELSKARGSSTFEWQRWMKK
jgi:TPR repeat protein